MSAYDELDDDRLDALLRNVAPPDGLRTRLEAVPLDDAELDRRVRDVAVPFGLVHRLRRIAAGPRWTMRRLAVAAALFVVVGGWYAALLGSLVGMQYEQKRPLAATVRRAEAAGVGYPLPARTGDAEPEVVFARSGGVAGPPPEAVSEFLHDVVRMAHGNTYARRTSALDGLLLTAAGGGTRPIETLVLGAPSPVDALPDARFAALRVPRGVEAPLGARERRFLLDAGVFPFVSSEAFAASSVAPSFDTTAFELAREHLAAGKLPPVEQMRVEEFLAACDFGYARTTTRPVRLFTAGAVAPWNGPLPADVPPPTSASRLLQISVQAGELPAARRKPTYLTVGVDVTASMATGSRLSMARQALTSLVERLGPNDRLTLVALGAEVVVIVDEGSRNEIDQLLAAVESLRPQGAGRLADGVLQTLLTAGRRAEPKNVVRRAVVISDSCGEFDPVGIDRVEQFLKTDAGRSLHLDLVDVGPDDWENEWAETARRCDGLVTRAATADRIRSALRQSLTGQDQLVARDVNVTVTFHADAVAAFRLFGHEPTALTAGLPRRLDFDLSAGQTGTVLYELKLHDRVPNEIATVVLKWRDPATGEPQEEVRSITRGQLGATFEKSAPALQTATLAAATAGRLRNSPLPDNLPPSVLLQWARRLERSRNVRGLEPWLTLLSDLERVAARRPAARGMK